jgi:hypothetical protein
MSITKRDFRKLNVKSNLCALLWKLLRCKELRTDKGWRCVKCELIIEYFEIKFIMKFVLE